MYALEIAALGLFALAAVRTFSFGVYGLRHGRGGAFALALLLVLAGGVLAWYYVT